jgi:hypothetical protein
MFRFSSSKAQVKFTVNAAAAVGFSAGYIAIVSIHLEL